MINNNFAMKIIYSFRLIYNEYCGNDKYRFRYDKNKICYISLLPTITNDSFAQVLRDKYILLVQINAMHG